MRILPAAMLLLPLFAAATFAACDPVDCSKQSELTNKIYCSGGDLYGDYLEYYCDGNECISRIRQQLIEDCRMGCAGVSCITCNAQECQAKSGFVSTPYCSSNNVYQTYRQYECDFNQGCTFSESQRLAEECKDATCSNGRCGLCDPADCNARDGFTGEDFCGLNRVILRTYRDYRCSTDKCVSSEQDVKIGGCEYSCYNGRCELPLCEPGCDSKDAFSGEPYCKGSSVYRKYDDYFCGGIRCDFNQAEKKVEDCRECKDGKCVTTKTQNSRLFEFEVKFSNEAAEKNKTAVTKRIFNGILFGSGDEKITVNAFVKSISFTVLETNRLGNLMIFVDGKQLFFANSSGSYTVPVNAEIKYVVFMASSSGLIFWMPAVYDVGLITIATEEPKTLKNEFAFQLNRAEYNNLKSAEVIAWPSSTRIALNGRTLQSSIIDKNILKLDNRMEFTSLIEETFSRKAVIQIIYEE